MADSLDGMPTAADLKKRGPEEHDAAVLQKAKETYKQGFQSWNSSTADTLLVYTLQNCDDCNGAEATRIKNILSPTFNKLGYNRITTKSNVVYHAGGYYGSPARSDCEFRIHKPQ